ncbi:hypothetical protein HpMS107_51440 [Helicobacter pylori]
MLAVVTGGLNTEARAQTLSSDGSLSWGITKSSGPSTSTVNGTSLVIAGAALTIGLVATGGVPAAIVATGRALTVAGAVVGPIAAGMLRAAVARGPLTGAMLALALALGSDAAYDSASNSFKSAQTTQYGPYVWFAPGHDTSGPFYADPPTMCNALAQAAGLPGVQSFSPSGGTSNGYYIQYTCSAKDASGSWVSLGSMYSKATTVQTVPSTDAQLGSAAAAPSALAKVWDAGGCGAKISLYRDTVDPSDPCAQIVNSPGAVWTPVGLPNGGYITFPPKSQTVTDSTGKVLQTTTTTPTAQVNANTDQPTMGVSPVIVTPGSVVKTVTNNADGTQTTTTTTSTNPGTKTEQPQDGTATFGAGNSTLYTPKGKTMASVLNAFSTAIQQAPWFTATTGWFNVTAGSASCPVWVVPKTDYTPAVDMSVVFCSQQAVTIYGIAGLAVIVVAAWAAFRIAFL